VKETLFYLILVSLIAVVAFFLGREGPLDTHTQQSVQALEQLQQRLQRLEQVVATSLQVNIKPDTTAMFEQAQALLKQNNLVDASLYFSNIVNQERGNLEVLRQYKRSLLPYLRQIMAAQPEQALSILAEVENFLRTQVIYLHTSQDILQLQQWLTDIAKLRTEITAILAAQVLEKKQRIFAKSDELLQQAPTVIEPLRKKLTALQALDTTWLDDNQIAEINKKIETLTAVVTQAEQQLAKERSLAAISLLEQRANDFINKARQEPPLSNFILYYLNTADTLIRQLILVEPEVEAVKVKVNTLSTNLEEAKKVIADKQSELAWLAVTPEMDKFQALLELVKAGKMVKYQDAIEQLYRVRETIVNQLGKLVAEKYVYHAQTVIKQVSDQLTKFQQEQMKAYDTYVINKIAEFHKEVSQKTGIRDDERGIYNDMISYLGEIDLRLVSLPVSTAYSEAFNTYYAELGNAQKIKLTAKMVLHPKKSLTDF
jgi:hypothetical protein